MSVTAKCRACGEEKPVTEFHPERARATGHAESCKVCVRKRRREQYAARNVKLKARKAERGMR